MKSSKEIINIGKQTIAVELDAITKLKDKIDDNYVQVIREILNSKGRLIVAGIGKSANIANKMVATFNSTGQPAIFLHAADAIHGDIGNIQQDDIVIFISKSGNTSEIKTLLPYIKKMGNLIIAITGNIVSYLAKESDYFIDVSVEKEACPNNLAPTSSTTAQLVMGDAIAVTLLASKSFSDEDFARFHPGGILGKRLYLKVSDMLSGDDIPSVNLSDKIEKIIIEISKNRVGATAVLEGNELQGIITDGDLRRMLQKGGSFIDFQARDIMSLRPKTVDVSALAYDALNIMKKNNISQLIVMSGKEYKGIIHIHEIIKEGLV